MAADEAEGGTTRRGVLSTGLMLIGLVAGYGLGAFHFFRYLVPLGKDRAKKLRPMFIGTLEGIPVGSSFVVKDPRGQGITVTREADDLDHPDRGFRALSSVCPHLGCKVHWESAKGHFLCPCHQGIFDKEGVAVSGPPAKEGKNLATYEIEVDPQTGWVFVMVSQEQGYGV
jgi:cytochrome b6-f complex iron-sulfur subunit